MSYGWAKDADTHAQQRKARIMNHGQRTAANAIARRLHELFPLVEGIDFAVVAANLVESVEMAAVETMHRREQQLQQTLQGLMQYYADLIATTQERVRALEKERMDLLLEVGKHQDGSTWAVRDVPEEG